MATTKSTAAKKASVAKKIASFEEFRERALKATRSPNAPSIVTDEPFVLGPEDGFDPPVVIEKPNFTLRFNLSEAMNNGDVSKVLRLVLMNDINRVFHVIDEYERETGVSGDEIITGIVISYFEHFYGVDAAAESFRAIL